jgi:flagellin
MRITHNISAMNTYNRMQGHNKTMAASTQKLSSGLRIGQAADDAAGLRISERMRSQIRGLEQAERNLRDGISLLETAEGGLSRIADSYLQRLRELSVQAANDTLEPNDRQNIQGEVDQIIKGIDDIANHTEFNNIKLLRPPIVDIPPSAGTGKADIVFVIDNTGSMSGIQTNVANNITSFINSIAGRGVSDIRMGVLEYADSDVIASSFAGSKWSNDISAVSGEIMRLASTNRGGIEEAMRAISYAADNYDFRDNENGLQTKHIIFITNEDADDDGNVSATLADLQSKGIKAHGVYYTSNSDVSEFHTLVNGTGGKSVNLASSSWGNALSSVIGDAIGGSAGSVIEADDMPVLTLQVGADIGDKFRFELFDARAAKLGIAALSVSTAQDASAAIDKVDSALKLVLAERSKYGAYQNTLEHINNNVSNYKMNITTAESQIRDADMASEMMKLMNTKLVLESSQAMSAQAAQMTQSVLQVIK